MPTRQAGRLAKKSNSFRIPIRPQSEDGTPRLRASSATALCQAPVAERPVALPQSGLMLHRSRQLLVCQRTMLSNAIRGHMAELGIISAKVHNGTADP
jgi:transposase